MECLIYVDLPHDYSKSIILTIFHHITDTCICTIPPLNVCHLCQMCMKPNLRPAGPISPSPLLPLLWEFTSDVELDHILPLLVPVQLHHLPPLCPFFPTITICIWNKNFKKKVQIIWNWIRSCPLKEILHTYLLHFYWGILMMFGLSARHSPRGRPSNWPSMTPTPPQKGEDKGQQFMDWLIGWNQLHIQRYSLNCQECQHSDPSTYIIICIYAPTSAFLLK